MIANRARRLIDALIKLVTRTDTTLSEFWGSTMLIAMGIWLLLPEPTFQEIPAYRIMARMMPEASWGVLAISLGLVQSFGNLSKRPAWRSIGAFTASVMYGFIACLALLSESASLLTPICGTASFIEGVVYLRLSFLKSEAPRAGT